MPVVSCCFGCHETRKNHKRLTRSLGLTSLMRPVIPEAWSELTRKQRTRGQGKEGKGQTGSTNMGFVCIE